MRVKKVNLREYDTEFTVVIGKQFPEFERKLFALQREFNELMDEQSHPCYGCSTTAEDYCRHCPQEEDALALIADDVEHEMYEEKQVMIAEMGSEGIYDAQHDPIEDEHEQIEPEMYSHPEPDHDKGMDNALELRHQHPSDLMEEPGTEPVMEYPSEREMREARERLVE